MYSFKEHITIVVQLYNCKKNEKNNNTVLSVYIKIILYKHSLT